jgi:ribose transport system permease protein
VTQTNTTDSGPMSFQTRRGLGLSSNRSFIVLLALLIALLLTVQLIRPGTLGPGWVSNIVLFAAPLGLLAGAQTLVLLTGGIDLSVASIATASAYVMAANIELGVGPAVALGLLIAILVGLLNGIGIALFRVLPMIMTLGTSLMVMGLLTVYSQIAMAQRSGVPEFLLVLGSSKISGVVPYSLFVWLPIGAILILGLSRSGFGRSLYAVGDNPKACKIAGIRIWKVLVADYVASGLLSGVAGLLLIGSTNAADLGLANTYLLPSVAAAVIGGTSIFGGRGGYSGTVIGAFILTILESLMTLLNASEPIKQIIYGSVILLIATGYTKLSK